MIAARLWTWGYLGITQAEATVVASAVCPVLDGTYGYHGKVEWRSDQSKSPMFPSEVGFNEALTRVGVVGDVQGVRMHYSTEKRAYEVEILGRDLLTGAHIAKTATSYELSVTCEGGRYWVHRLRIAGGGEGVTSVGERLFYLSKEADGSLHIHVDLKGTSTTLLFFKTHWNGSADYVFSALLVNPKE